MVESARSKDPRFQQDDAHDYRNQDRYSFNRSSVTFPHYVTTYRRVTTRLSGSSHRGEWTSLAWEAPPIRRFDPPSFAVRSSSGYPYRVATTAKWTTRRKLFLFETLIFLACTIGAIVFELTGHGSSHALKGAVFLLVVFLVHIALRLTYFKSVLPEIRQQRRTHQSE
jgi:hypothetical protein